MGSGSQGEAVCLQGRQDGQDLPRLCPSAPMPFCNLWRCPWLLERLSTDVVTEGSTTGECSYDDCHSFPWMLQQHSGRLLTERPGAGDSFWAIRELGIISKKKLEDNLKEWATAAASQATLLLPLFMYCDLLGSFPPPPSLRSPHL